jgi:23S rRNA (uracil1939-C5)-methyltransferase
VNGMRPRPEPRRSGSGAGPVNPEAATAVVIESLAAGGDGVGRLPDGMTVFVPRSAPGDRVRVSVVRRRRRYARGTVREVLERGPGRAEPACVHFARDGCGGCQWQHLKAEVQAEAKRRIVGDALRRLGGLPVEDPPLVPSPAAYGYRATITLAVRWEGDRPVVGFHDGERVERVFPLERCEIAREEIRALWSALRSALGALPRGADVRLKLRAARDGTLHVMVLGGEGAWTGARQVAAAAAASGRAATVWWHPAGGAARRMAGPAADRGALAFEQVNAEVGAGLLEAVLGCVPAGARRVLDLYAGTGETGLALAGPAREVVSVEVDRAAAGYAERQARRTGHRIEVVAARVEDVLERLLPADLVILNPPRTGLAAAAAAALERRPPELLLYVSCDPATLARDLRRLGAQPARLRLRCYDMFPQTSHVETLAVLARSEPTSPAGPEELGAS